MFDSDGMAAIFGPTEKDCSAIVQSLCDAKEIPNLQMRWEPKQRVATSVVNIYPHPSSLSRAYVDLAMQLKWKKFTIIYENHESIVRLSDLLNSENNNGSLVKFRQLPETNTDYRFVLRELKRSKDYNIVVDCSINMLSNVLNQAQQVGLMTPEHSIIVTNLDLHTLDLEPFRYSGAEIIGLRMIVPNNPLVEDTARSLSEFINASEENAQNVSSYQLPLKVALIYDAVKIFHSALQSVSEGVESLSFGPISCSSADSWLHGYSIVNQIKVSSMEGLSGAVKFDHRGFRTDFQLDIYRVAEEGVVPAGYWDTKHGPKLDYWHSDYPAMEERNLKNVTLTVCISFTKPHGMRKKSANSLKGNDQYEGFGVDLIHELSLMSGFKYRFIVQEDGKNGNPIATLPNGTRKWNGMIGAVLDYRADLAIADITITRDREKDVDFTPPFMDLGIAILYKKPAKAPPSLFSFLSPFSNEVWLYLITAYVGFTLLLFVVGRISPYEWQNPYPCIEEPEELENQFTLSNTFFFTIGALMQQGSDIAPISVSTRLAAGVWWFFTLIMVSSYTANLAAFLTSEKPYSPFENVEELADQNDIKYGAKDGGTTILFFKDSSNKVYQRMYNYMSVNPDVMTTDNAAGVARVRDEKNYAFLMESSSIEYEVERECTLAQVGDLLDNKGYGIVMRKGSWYLSELSQHILFLQERGKLSTLKRKWWKEKYSGSCEAADSNDAETLGLLNVGGVFLVLGAGIGVAFVIAFLELLFATWSSSKQNGIPFVNTLSHELKFILRCRGSTKPILTSADDEHELSE